MKVAFVFPGQGAQAPGMGRELARSIPVCRELFEAADTALEFPISELCFSGSAEQLALTENTQPAILSVSVAALRALEARGIRAQGAAGHSLGEYSAHVAAGTLEFADALRTVRARGRFMQEAVPVGVGAMAAVLGLDLKTIQEVCATVSKGQIVQPANINSPGQIVLGGHSEAVERAIAACLQAGARRAVALSVSAPFHSELMQPAAEKLRPVLNTISFSDPGIPVYTNVDAVPVSTGSAAREALLGQVAAPVRWSELIERMAADGFDTFVEIGPGNVLCGLIRRISKQLRTVAVSDSAGVEKAFELLGETH